MTLFGMSLEAGPFRAPYLTRSQFTHMPAKSKATLEKHYLFLKKREKSINICGTTIME